MWQHLRHILQSTVALQDKNMPEQNETITVEKALELGLQHYEAKRLPEAEHVYAQILNKFPDQHVALHMLGLIAHIVGNNEVAVDLITKSVRIKPDYVDAHNNLGIALQISGRHEDAIASYGKALAINPNFPAAHNNLGLTHYQLGNIQEAITKYQNALDISSDYFDAHLNMGVALAFIGKLEEAVAAYRKAVEIKPDHVETHTNLGATLRNLGRLEEAINSYETAVALQPDYADAHNSLGNTLRDDDRSAEAIASYQTALVAHPDFTIAQHNIGTTLQELGRVEEAVGYLEKIDTALSRPALLECIYSLGDKSRFYSELKSITEKDKTNIGVAAVSAFASHQFNCPDPYPFCNSPLDFIHKNNLLTNNGMDDSFLDVVSEEIVLLKLGGGNQSLLHAGFQSSGSLFIEPRGSLAQLAAALQKEINSYFSHYSESSCLYVKLRPQDYILRGWYIVMRQGGFLKPHNHPSGWLSGVLYLKIPAKNGDEGNIEFGLHGKDLPVLNHEYPKKICSVTEGDLVLFPSSLFHRTLPFSSKEKRLCIAFDLTPKEK